MSQPRISQIGRLLSAEGVRFAEVHEADQRALLAYLYVAHHRPQVLRETYWYGLDRQLEQAELAAERLEATGAHVVVSADAGPDYVAPYRSPTLSVVYSDTPPDLGAVGFVPALGLGDASIVVREVTDPSLLEPWAPPRAAPFPVAHPLQQVWDLCHLGGVDRKEAADRVVRYLVMHPEER
ncbi:MAG TPA: hypothetical protein VNF07_11460 [Acidimicrobiales bacterium]|nr:hypothetical protein [Acidimicrobiales bacterium]